jgi:RNA polymerase sigma-70 factor (ECF subfamily)
MTPTLDAAVARYHDPLVRYATRIVGDPDRARDVVQDTFVKLCEAADSIDHERLGQWLYTVCRNRAYDVRRNEARVRTDAGEPDAIDARPDDALEMLQVEQQLWEALGALDDVKRRVVELRYNDGHSYKRISELTGLSVSNVGFVLHASVRALRKELVVAAAIALVSTLVLNVWLRPAELATAERIEVPTVAVPQPPAERVRRDRALAQREGAAPKPAAKPRAKAYTPARPVPRAAKPPPDSANAWSAE